MLDIARARHDGPLMLMDAQKLDFPDDDFDAAVVAFVLFHLPEPDRSLSEVARVLRPGGRVGIVTWGQEGRGGAYEVWDDELAAAGSMPEDMGGSDSCDQSNTETKLSGLMAEAGFTDIDLWTEPFNYTWDPEHFYRYMSGATYKERLAALQPVDRDACLLKIQSRLKACDAGDFRRWADFIFASATTHPPHKAARVEGL
jgi:SAM-dependent methyltransferase